MSNLPHVDGSKVYEQLRREQLLKDAGMSRSNIDAALTPPLPSLFDNRLPSTVAHPDYAGQTYDVEDIPLQVDAMQVADDVLTDDIFSRAQGIARDQLTSIARAAGDLWLLPFPGQRMSLMDVRRTLHEMGRRAGEKAADIAGGAGSALEATGMGLAGALGWAIDSDPGQIVLGLVDPAVRLSQVGFGWMAGEGSGALRRLADRAYPMPREDGGVKYTTAFDMTMDFISAAFSGPPMTGTGLPFGPDVVKVSDAMEHIRAANSTFFLPGEGQPELLNYTDVMDAAAGGAGVRVTREPESGIKIFYVEDKDGQRRRYGREAMNDLYGELNQSWYGRVGLAGMAIVATIGDLADPVMLVEPFIGLTGKGMATLLRKAAPAAAARSAITVARRSGDWSDAVVAAERTAALLRRAELDHQRRPTEASFRRLKNAASAHDEMALEAARREVGVYSPWRPDDVGKRNPATINTRQMNPIRAKLRNPQMSETRGTAAMLEETRGKMLARIDDVARQHDEAIAFAKEGGKRTDELERQARDLQRWRQRVAVEDLDELPEEIVINGQRVKTLSLDDIRDIQEAERIAALKREGVNPGQFEDGWRLFDDETMDEMVDRRIIDGPSLSEESGKGLAHAADGGSPEDIAMTLDDPRLFMGETAKTMPPGIRGGWIQQEHVVNASKKFLRNLKDQSAKQTDLRIRVVEEAGEGLPAKVRWIRADGKTVDMKWDDSWLPKQKTAEELIKDGWYDSFAAESWNNFAEALLPGTYRPNYTRQLGRANFVREAMRVWEGRDPGGMWPIYSQAVRAAEAEVRRHQAWFSANLRRFGALIEPSAAGKGARAVKGILFSGEGKRLRVDKARAKQLFDILNTSPTENPTGFQKLLDELTPEQQQAAIRIREMLNLDAEMLGIRGMPDRFIDGYVHHAWDPAWEGHSIYMPEFRGLSNDGRIFFKALATRSGKEGFVPDAVAALDIYSRGIGRKLHLEPALDTLLKRAKYIATQDKDPFFLNYTKQAVDIVKGKPSLVGQWVDRQLMGAGNRLGFTYTPGQAHRATMALSSMIYGGLLGGNRRYPVMALATSLATTSSKYGSFRTVKGLFASATPEGQAVFKMSGLDGQWKKLIDDAQGAIRSSSKTDRVIDKIAGAGERMSRIRPLAPSVQESEDMIRGMTMWAHIDNVLDNLGVRKLADLDPAQQRQVIAESVLASEAINHVFGPLGRPPGFQALSRSGTAVGTQFLSFGPKQTETLLALAAENPGYLLRFMMVSGYLARTASQDLNMNIRDYVGVGYTQDMLAPRNITSPGVELVLGLAGLAGVTLSTIGGTGDPIETDKAFEEFGRSFMKALPGMTIASQAYRTTERATTGEQRQPLTGELLDPSVDLEPGQRGKRSEWPSLITAIESENSRVERMAGERMRKIQKQAVWEAVKVGRRIEEAAVDGRYDDVIAGLERLAELGIPQEQIDSKLDASMMALNFGQLAREIIANPKLADVLIETMQSYQQEFE